MAAGDRLLTPDFGGVLYSDMEVTDETIVNGVRQMARLRKLVDDSGNTVNPAAPVLAAGSNLIGRVSASEETSTVYNGTTALTPKFAPVAAASANDNAIVAAVPTKKIRVLSYVLTASAAVNAKWRSATTDKTGLLYCAANGGASSGHSPVGHFETAAGEALNLHLSGAVAVGGHVTYVEVS